MSLCFAQREEGTDEEDEDAPGDYIGDRLAHARLEATGQLYREVRSVDWERGAFIFAAITFQQQYVLSHDWQGACYLFPSLVAYCSGFQRPNPLGSISFLLHVDCTSSRQSTGQACAKTVSANALTSLSLLDTRGIIQGCVGLTARILGPALPFLLRSRKACRDSK